MQVRGTLLVVLATICFLQAFVVKGANRKATQFQMPEYETYDTEKYNYELISEEDIWDYNVVQDIGVVNLTTTIYME